MENKDKIYLDQAGYQQYLKEIEEIKDKIKKSGKQKSSAFESAVGDGWHDNFDFEEAKREELKLSGMLQSKLDGLSRIIIVEHAMESDLVDINDYVTVESSSKGENLGEMIFKLVASSIPNLDGDVFEISINSPLGKAVYQKKIGESASYIVNDRTFDVVIINKSKTLKEEVKDQESTSSLDR